MTNQTESYLTFLEKFTMLLNAWLVVATLCRMVFRMPVWNTERNVFVEGNRLMDSQDISLGLINATCVVKKHPGKTVEDLLL